MTTQKKNASNTNKFLKERLAAVNKAITKFEGEVEKAVERFVKKSEKSSKVMRKNFDEILEKISGSEFYSMASEKTEGISKEVKRLADDIVAKVKQFDIKKANTILNEVRENIDQIVEKLQNAEIVEMAKDRAATTRNQVLNVLSIPTREDMNQLSRKVSVLEKKVKTLSTKKAA